MGTAVAKRTATAVKHQKSISEMVVQINVAIYDSANAERRCNKLRLKAGQLLLQLRQRIEAGEEGDVSWWEWFEDLGNNGHPALIRSRKDAERLMRIASADDPEQALLDEREKTRLAVARHREEKAAELTVSSKPEVASRAEFEAHMLNGALATERLWLQEHPGRSREDYDAGLGDSQSEVWEWKRAKGRASNDAMWAAWLGDHPGNPLCEHLCGLSEEEGTACDEWLEGYEEELAEQSVIDEINPQSCRTAYLIRTTYQTAEMARECAALLQRLESSTKRMHGRGKLIDAAAYAARAWAELLTALQNLTPEKNRILPPKRSEPPAVRTPAAQ